MSSVSLTSAGSTANSLIPNFCSSTGRCLLRGRRFDRHGRRGLSARPLKQSGIAGMSRFDEELRLLDQAARGLFAVLAIALLVTVEQVLRELAAGEAIEEELGVVEAPPKLGHYRLG